MAKVVKVQATPYDAIFQKATKALGGYSSGAMRTTASQQAQAQLQPQIVAQQNANAQQQQLLSNLYNRQTGFALAMSKLADPNATQARSDYLAAAQTMGNLGQGITGAVGADWKAAADQASQAAAGMTGGQGSVQGLYDPGGLQSSGYTTNFALPGASLAEQAVTAAAEARNRQLSTANELGVMAANTQAQQAQAATEGSQALAQIRAQQPGIFQNALQAQREMGQQAFSNLSQLAGNRASYLQNAAQMAQSGRQFTAQQKETAREFGITQAQHTADVAEQARQFGITSTEQHAVDTANMANAKAQTAITAGYLGIQGKKLQGQLTAQDLANQQAVINRTGIDPITHRLAAGWIRDPKTGQPIQYNQYISGLNAVASLKRAQQAGQPTAAQVTAIRSSAVAAVQKALNPAPPKYVRVYTTGHAPDPNNPGKTLTTHESHWEAQPGTGGTTVPYDTTLSSIIAMGPDTPAWKQQATNIVNSAYVPFALQYGQTAIQNGLGYQAALNRARATGIVPDSILVPALKRAYGTPAGKKLTTAGAGIRGAGRAAASLWGQT